MKGKLEVVRRAVMEIANEIDWRYHICPVLSYAKQLAQLFPVDEEILELSVLLHDIGRIKFGSYNHHLTGLPEAEKILKQAEYSDETISRVKHCIKAHRGLSDVPFKTIAAEIVANADAMSHFDILPLFFLPKSSRQLTGDDINEKIEWVEAKIDRDWNQKLTIPQARDIVRERYQAIKLILGSIKKLT